MYLGGNRRWCPFLEGRRKTGLNRVVKNEPRAVIDGSEIRSRVAVHLLL